MTRDELEAFRREHGAFTKAETREILGGVSEDYLERLVREDKLRVIRDGGRVLIPASAIREYLGGGEPLPQKARKAPPPP